MFDNIKNLMHADSPKQPQHLIPLGIYRCSHCKIWGQAAQNHQAICQQCSKSVTVHEPLQIVEQLSARYTAALREIDSLKSQLEDNETSEDSNISLQNLDLNNTEQFANATQHQPLAAWFKKHNIQPEFDYSAVNTSGFYDEAAEKIGKNYPLLTDLMKKLSWSYRKNVLNLNIDLKKYNQKQQQKINNICRQFYSHTLFSVYNYNKQDKTLFLKLQTAAPIRQFFMGSWLEWFALNEVLQTVKQKNVPFSVARNVKIQFNNQDIHELDVMLYAKNGSPIVIECKTGEYRRDLDKYLTLRKRLNIPAENFILLVLDIDEKQAKSLSGMYDLQFVTLETLAEHMKNII